MLRIDSISYGFWLMMTTDKKVVTGVTKQSAADINYLKGLVESDKLRPVIDRTYTMNEMVAAHSYVETGRKKGNVAITVSLN